MAKFNKLKILLSAAVTCGALGLAAASPAKADSIGIGVGPHGSFSLYLSDDDHHRRGYGRHHFDRYYGRDYRHADRYGPPYGRAYGYHKKHRRGHGHHHRNERRHHRRW